MHFINYIIWFSCILLFYIIFSVKTMISLVSFTCLILLVCLFLLVLHLEYIAFFILLLYLGGILIFFLYITLLINNECDIQDKNTTTFRLFLNLSTFIGFMKSLILLCGTHSMLFQFLQVFQDNFYFPTQIFNNYTYNSFVMDKDDMVLFLNFYTEKFLVFIYLGLLFLYSMIAIILMIYNKYYRFTHKLKCIKK